MTAARLDEVFSQVIQITRQEVAGHQLATPICCPLWSPAPASANAMQCRSIAAVPVGRLACASGHLKALGSTRVQRSSDGAGVTAVNG